MNIHFLSEKYTLQILSTKWQPFLPEASFDLWVLSLPVSVCVSVFPCFCVSACQPWACTYNNSLSVQARITRGTKQLGWGPYCFGEHLTLTFKVKLDLKLKFTPFWNCTCDKSPPIEDRTTKCGQKMQNTLVINRIVWGIDWCWSSWSYLIEKLKFHESLICPLEKIHNSHVEMAYLDSFMVPTVSWSPSPACTYLPRLLQCPDCFTDSTLCTCTNLGSWGYFSI